MSLITPKIVTIAGGNLALGNAASGDTAQCGDGYLLLVKNGDAAAKTVTITVPGNLPTGDAYPDKAYVVPAGEMWPIPLLGIYADPTDGVAHIAYSATTNVTRAVVKA
jgi:hypothetical protein